MTLNKNARFAILRSFAVFGTIANAMTAVCAQEPLPQVALNANQVTAKPNVPSLNFEKTGPQVGEQVPDLRLHTLKEDEQRLSDAWHGGPALLVTSSLTCPKSRSRWPELKELVDRYEGKVNVVVIYVIEAHPVGSACPYKEVEDITPENERDGILRRQPKTLEDRLELAQEFKRLLRIHTPIYVDNLKDEAWKGLGAAPNLALLVDQKGMVVARSGWFEGTKSREAIDQYLSKESGDASQVSSREQLRKNAERVFSQLENAGIETHRIGWLLRDDDAGELVKVLKAVPAIANHIIESHQGHPYDSTLLMDAVREGKSKAVKLLLECGADVKARTESFDSAFQIAAQTGDVPIAKLLLEGGADPSFPHTGLSPLHEAAIHGHTEFVKLLIDLGVRHDLYSAIALGEVDMVRKGLQVDVSRALRPDGAQRMPLDYAAANGQLEIAKLLLAHGAPVVRDRFTRLYPPLHRAIARNDVAMTKLLLEAGSSPDTSVGYDGEYAESRPALHLAISQKSLAIVRLLLDHKADLKARDTYSRTALHDAAAGQAEIAAALLRSGADVNAPQLGYALPCGSGEERIPSYATPLHYAAEAGDLATLKVLISAGANVNAATKRGETPLMYAALRRRSVHEPESSLPGNIELLIAAGADVNALDRKGRSVLDVILQAHQDDDSRSKRDLEAVSAVLQKHGAKAGISKVKNPDQNGPFER
jgi:ankyrin repeat protein